MTKPISTQDVRTFPRGGIFLSDDKKSLTAMKPMEHFYPKEVTIPLAQHLGAPAKAIVSRKQKVTRGDVIGEADSNGAPIHASVTGVVKRVALSPHPILVESLAVVIEADPSSQSQPVWEEVPEWFTLPKEKMLEQIANAGIVGLGGAAFPTHRKLRLPEGIIVDTLILNGAECEPYLTGDYRLLLEKPKELLFGALLIAKILDAKNILIGIEENKEDAAKILQTLIDENSFHPKPKIILCETRYPQGSEKQLVEALTGRSIPPGKLPMHQGVMVQNVATAFACYLAIRYRQPLLDRWVTVSGSGIIEPKNLLVPLGTLLSDIVSFCGGIHPQTNKVIAGGAMMGRTLGRLDLPVIKQTNGFLFLKADEVGDDRTYGPCISCGRCLRACPLGLEPNQISVYTETGHALETTTFGTKECFECGCCAYVCPASRPLVQFIQVAKSALRGVST